MTYIIKYTAMFLLFPLLLIASDPKELETSTVLKSDTETIHSQDSQTQPTIKATTQVVETATPQTVAVDNKTKGREQIIQVGDKNITITIPAVPRVPTLEDYNLTSKTMSDERSIKFSKRVPPGYVAHKFDKMQEEKKNTPASTQNDETVGEVINGQISAYLRGEYIEADAVQKKLEDAGFTVLAVSEINKEKDLISMVFTNQTLLDLANQDNRGFIASLRVLIDSKEKRISITNPLYMAKGFLQESFNQEKAQEVLVALRKGFTQLTNSKDALKFQLLPSYQFMKGMPLYQDMVEVATGDELLKKAKENKHVVFVQTLQNGSSLLGIKLEESTAEFTKKIGRNNAAMLPYPILIQNNKAYVLDPKYYISFMYPKLSMSEFMMISTVPAEMIKECEKIFQ